MEIAFDLNNDFKSVTEYDFGEGPVAAHQHPKGNGWVADTAYVDETCFVGPFARVYGNAKILEKAVINDHACVFGNATVTNTARVYGDAQVYDNAFVSGNSRISGFVKVYGNSKVMDNAQLYESAEVFEDGIVCNNAEVFEKVKVYGQGIVYDNIKLYGNQIVTRKPIVGLGFDYPFAITDHHVMLGCTVMAPYYLQKMGRRIINLFKYTQEQSELWLDVADKLVRIHGCTSRDEDISNDIERKMILDLLTERNAVSDRDPRTR